MKNILVLEKVKDRNRNNCFAACSICTENNNIVCTEAFIWKKSDKILTFKRPMIKTEGKCEDCAIWNLCKKDEITKKELFGLCTGGVNGYEIFAWADEVPVWETCTLENTKIGDIVREKRSIEAEKTVEYIVEYIDRHHDKAVLYNERHKQCVYGVILRNYEINTNKDK